MVNAVNILKHALCFKQQTIGEHDYDQQYFPAFEQSALLYQSLQRKCQAEHCQGREGMHDNSMDIVKVGERERGKS